MSSSDVSWNERKQLLYDPNIGFSEIRRLVKILGSVVAITALTLLVITVSVITTQESYDKQSSSSYKNEAQVQFYAQLLRNISASKQYVKQPSTTTTTTTSTSSSSTLPPSTVSSSSPSSTTTATSTTSTGLLFHACEVDGKPSFQCKEGFVIDVITAFYGSKSSSVCGPAKNEDKNCNYSGFEFLLKTGCNGERVCSMDTSKLHNAGGSFCRGAKPHIEVNYNCLPDSCNGNEDLCMNGGRCVTNTNGSPSCDCTSDWVGPLCDIRRYDHPSCHFPFTYEGVEYNTCREAGWGLRWCSTTPSYDENWVHCQDTTSPAYEYSWY